jgi:hypothetical protein
VGAASWCSRELLLSDSALQLVNHGLADQGVHSVQFLRPFLLRGVGLAKRSLVFLASSRDQRWLGTPGIIAPKSMVITR